MSEPLASVLCITYNHAPYIAQAVESFLAQETTFPFEIVIGEDCSTDETREVVFEYKKRYPGIIRVVTSEENVGAVPNFVRTFQACRGKYIAICEGDDYWHHPGKLEIQVQFLEQHPGYGTVHSEFDVSGNDGNVLCAHYRSVGAKHQSVTPSLEDILGGEYRFTTCTVCSRRSLIAAVIESDPVCFGGAFTMCDLPLFLGLATLAPVQFLDQSLATYRRHGASLTGCNDYRKRADFVSSAQGMVHHLIAKYKIDSQIAKPILCRLQHAKLALAYWQDDATVVTEIYDNMRKEGPPVPLASKLYYWCMRVPPLNGIVRPILSLRKWWLRRQSFC